MTGGLTKEVEAIKSKLADMDDVKRQVSGMTQQFTKLMATLEQDRADRAQGGSRRRTSNKGKSNGQRSTTEYIFTAEGVPVCNYCKQEGHIARNCEQRRINRQNNATQSNQGGR